MSQRTLLDFGLGNSKKRKQNETEAVQQPAKKAATETKVRCFQAAWLKQFGWLEFDSQLNRMFCKVCRAANKQNSFTKEGAGVHYYINSKIIKF